MNDPAQINRLALRLAPFNPKCVQLYFAQAEIAFQLAGITTDEAKYANLIAALPAELLIPLTDLVLNPPATDRYNTLKARLIAEYKDSEGVQVRKLLHELQLGDLRPSALLTNMRALAENKVTDEFLKMLWLKRLPLNMQAILSASKEDLTQLATMADKIAEVIQDIPQMSIVRKEKVETPAAPSNADLQSQIDKITRQIDRLFAMRSRSPSWQGNRITRPQGKGKQEVPAKQPDKICYAHKRFGEKAYPKSCKPPCSFSATQAEN